MEMLLWDVFRGLWWDPCQGQISFAIHQISNCPVAKPFASDSTWLWHHASTSKSQDSSNLEAHFHWSSQDSLPQAAWSDAENTITKTGEVTCNPRLKGFTMEQLLKCCRTHVLLFCYESFYMRGTCKLASETFWNVKAHFHWSSQDSPRNYNRDRESSR